MGSNTSKPNNKNTDDKNILEKMFNMDSQNKNTQRMAETKEYFYRSTTTKNYPIEMSDSNEYKSEQSTAYPRDDMQWIQENCGYASDAESIQDSTLSKQVSTTGAPDTSSKLTQAYNYFRDQVYESDIERMIEPGDDIYDWNDTDEWKKTKAWQITNDWKNSMIYATNMVGGGSGYKKPNPIIDIFNNILAYNGIGAIIIDDGKYLWFCGPDIARILGYSSSRKTIINNVDAFFKTTFANLHQYVDRNKIKLQPNTVFFNEAGLFQFIFASKMPMAKEFQKWVMTDVMPSIREYGIYQIRQKDEQKLRSMNDRLSKQTMKVKNQALKLTKLEKNNLKLRNDKQNQNRIINDLREHIHMLEDNQRNPNYPKGGGVYAIYNPNISSSLIRIGKSDNIINRLHVYNSGVPIRYKMVYFRNVSNPLEVESCIRKLLRPFQYIQGKDYYRADKKIIRLVFDYCADKDILVDNNISADKIVEINTNVSTDMIVGNTNNREIRVYKNKDNDYIENINDIYAAIQKFDDDEHEFHKYIKYITTFD